MRIIYKYPLEVKDYQVVTMPKNAQILTVQAQREKPCIWALVDTDNEPEERYFRMAGPEKRYFRMAGTGHPIRLKDKLLRYIGTFQLMGGDLIFHVFEIGSPKAENSK